MKLSSWILLITFILMLTALFAANLLLKKEYDKIDKSDLYWTYDKILQEPFKYLVIDGGNVTNIAYEQNNNCSVRLSKNWSKEESKMVKAYVKNDTLFVTFPNAYKDPHQKDWLKWNTLVRIFSPQLLYVNGINTDFKLFKLKQKSIHINLSGRSKLEVESYFNDLDSIHVTQKDSSQIVFEMSPDLKGTKPGLHRSINSEQGDSAAQKNLHGSDITRNNWETIYIKSVHADIQGVSLLDIGHAQIGSLKLTISDDTSAIILSGESLRQFKRQH